MNLKTFGEWLRSRRLKLDISPFKISEELGYKRVSAVYNFEYGVAPLPMPKWPVMARVLELSLEEFLLIMERFSPQKVEEFRVIQTAAAALSVEDGGSSAVQVLDEVDNPSDEKELKPYRLEGAQTAVLFQEGTLSNGFMNYMNELWRAGQKVGTIQIPSMSTFPSVTIVDKMKEVSAIGIFERTAGAETALRVKAAFLDALTGAGGFPHIHRVPKIYTCFMDQASQGLEAEHLRAFMDLLAHGGESRIIRMTDQSQISV